MDCTLVESPSSDPPSAVDSQSQCCVNSLTRIRLGEWVYRYVSVARAAPYSVYVYHYGLTELELYVCGPAPLTVIPATPLRHGVHNNCIFLV